MSRTKWLSKESELLTKLYLETPMSELQLEFPSRTPSSIRSQANRLGLSHPDRGEKISISRRRSSPINSMFTDTTNVKGCFLAGLIASDGNIYYDRRTPRITIKLKESDADYLEAIKDLIGVTNKLYLVKRENNVIQGRTVNTQNQVMLTLYSAFQAVTDLKENFNITPNKTYNLLPPKLTSIYSKLAYCTGYIDGDGSIYRISTRHKDKIYSYTKVAIYGQPKILYWMRDEVFGLINPNITKLAVISKKNARVSCLTITETAFTPILHEIDKLQLPYMRRKWDKLDRTPKTRLSVAYSLLKSSLKEMNPILDYKITENVVVDAYFPHKKLAIYLSNESVPSFNSKYLQYNRYRECNEKGIRLLQFWHHDIIDNTDLVMSMIKNALGITTTRIAARNCSITELTPHVYREFLRVNHLEGVRNSSLKLGLLHGHQLVAVMGFSRGHDYYELDRFCSLKGHVIMGGFSKLLSHGPSGRILSYSFNRYSNGDIYKSNGFSLISENKMSLFYYHDGELHNRNKYMKYKLVKKLGAKYQMLSERELAETIGAFQVFDAGTKTWEFTADN